MNRIIFFSSKFFIKKKKSKFKKKTNEFASQTQHFPFSSERAQCVRVGFQHK